MKKLNGWDWVALILLIVGGLNWGLVSLFSFDLVAALFGDMSVLSRIVYGIVGLSAVYLAIVSPRLGHARRAESGGGRTHSAA